jgi:hypothetical protein
MLDLWGNEVTVGDYVLHDSNIVSQVIKINKHEITVDYQYCWWKDGEPKIVKPSRPKKFIKVPREVFTMFEKSKFFEDIFRAEVDGHFPYWKGGIRPSKEQ